MPMEGLLKFYYANGQFPADFASKKFRFVFEILSLFSGKNQKVPKSAKRSARNDFALHSKSA